MVEIGLKVLKDNVLITGWRYASPEGNSALAGEIMALESVSPAPPDY
jgi:hypothetical protein